MGTRYGSTPSPISLLVSERKGFASLLVICAPVRVGVCSLCSGIGVYSVEFEDRGTALCLFPLTSIQPASRFRLTMVSLNVTMTPHVDSSVQIQ